MHGDSELHHQSLKTYLCLVDFGVLLYLFIIPPIVGNRYWANLLHQQFIIKSYDIYSKKNVRYPNKKYGKIRIKV